MPTYVYECSLCEKQFEAQQRITEDALDTCICGSKGTVKRVIQPIAVVFKGSGFHINDYAGSSAKPTEGPAKPTEATASESTGTAATSDAAPAETKPTAPATAAPATPDSSST